MFQITSLIYNRVATQLQDSINPVTIFSGTIEFDSDEVEICFTATIIPYYRREGSTEGIVDVLYDLVPVWWELHTTTSEGEVVNDFDFDSLKYLICQQ